MNSKYVQAATFCLVLSLLLALLAVTAFAHHHRYRAQDSTVQSHDRTPGMPKTFVSSHWALPSGDGFIRYFIDTSTMANVTPHPSAVATPSISQIHVATTDWESVENGALSSLDWRVAVSPDRADVIVRFDRCFGGQLGHFFVQAPHGGDGWHNDVTREARYWEEADLCIDGSNEWHSADAILSMISHEFGHAYGLHEGYRDLPRTGGCGPNDTIMDTIDDEFSTSV